MNSEKETSIRRNKMRSKNAPPEKAKNFKSAIKRLVKELSSYLILIIIAMFLAAYGSRLAIITPNKLSNLTDEISKGLVINTKNVEEITKNIEKNLSNENIGRKFQEILAFNISSNTIEKIMKNEQLSYEEKNKSIAILNKLAGNFEESKIKELLILPNIVLKEILPTTKYNEVEISTEDKKMLLKMIATKEQNSIPINVMKCLLEDIKINDEIISVDNQIELLSTMNNSDSENIDNIYEKLEKMPENMKKIIKPTMNFDSIKKIVYFLVCIYLISASFDYIEAIIMTSVANKFANQLRKRISVKINKLPLKYFDNNKTGDTLSRVTNDVDMISQTMNQSLSTLVSALALFIGTTIMMFKTNLILAATAILSSLIGFIFMIFVLSKSQKYFVAKQTELGNLNGHIEEIYSGLNVVKVYNGKKDSDEKFDIYNKRVYEANRKSQFLSGLMMPMMNFIGNLGYVCVCIVGALLTFDGKISFGVIVAFISYVRLFTSPLSQIAQSMNQLQSTAAASERVFEFLDEEEMQDESHFKKYLQKNEVKGNIEFKNVSFKYDGNDKPTINNFSVSVKSGQKIAIVGPTGAGKTTMVNLLMKFYEITSGEILIDGISTKELTRDNIHSLFTMVLQDTWLFDGTVKENIVYNRENISDEKVEEVCKIVGLDHFIKTLPNGYDSKMSDNDNVSSGQKQLLTIARGMIENAPFLILDEATSNVDTRTEELVQKAMDILMKDRTSFIIAHRLSTIKNADLILVMKDGNIIEQGSHDDLMKKNGFYAELYNSQFEL